MPKPHLPTTFPTLTTERLILRSLDTDDIPAIYRHFSDPQVVRFLMDPLESMEDAAEVFKQLVGMFIKGKGIYWALTLKNSCELVGICSFERFGPGRRGEVGFDLAPDWWGLGLMTEALTAVVDYGFNTLGLNEIIAITAPGNRRALRLLKRLGFKNLGVKKGELMLNLVQVTG